MRGRMGRQPSTKERGAKDLEKGSGDSFKSYERNLKGLRKICFVANIRRVCDWSLGFCALMWASAVLLGAYVNSLAQWDFFDVSLLLFLEGLRFSGAAVLRVFGIYRCWQLGRWALRLAEFFIPLGMGGFALLSIWSSKIGLTICAGKLVLHLAPDHPPAPAPVTSGGEEVHLPASLTVFYCIILADAIILLLGSSVAGIMRLSYFISNAKSLTSYHDKMLADDISWMQPGVDLQFAFEIQSMKYRKGKTALQVGKEFADLISYVFMDEKGMEAAEAALKSEDGYVREAAANMVGFWAVLEKLESPQNYKLPLRYHTEVLSELANRARESNGKIGAAAANSLGLLLEADGNEVIAMVLLLEADGDKELHLVDSLLRRPAKLLKVMQEPNRRQGISDERNKKGVAQELLQKELGAHIYALRQLLLCLKRLGSANGELCGYATQEQQLAAQKLVKRMSKALQVPLTNPHSTTSIEAFHLTPTASHTSISEEAIHVPPNILPSSISTNSTNSNPPNTTSNLPSSTISKEYKAFRFFRSTNPIHSSPTTIELTASTPCATSACSDEPIDRLDSFLSKCLPSSHTELNSYSQDEGHTKYYMEIKSMLESYTQSHDQRRRRFNIARYVLPFALPLICFGAGFLFKVLIPRDPN
eukprot:c12859_g1_i1 orf=237-2177(+)